MNAAGLLKILDTVGFKAIQALVSLSWQTVLLFLFTVLVLFLLRRPGTVFRHLVWTSFVCLLPVIPLLVWFAAHAGTPRIDVPFELPVPLAYQEYKAAPVTEAPSAGAEADAVGNIGMRGYPWALMAAAYALGVAFFLLTIVVGRARIKGWIRHGREITESRIVGVFGAAAEKLNIRRRARLIESTHINVPLTIGTVLPVILLPRGFADNISDTELHSLAVHEYAHIKRFDTLIFTMTVYVRALLFFHPAVWYATRKISVLAERACDDAVVSIVRMPTEYAELLTRLAITFTRRRFATEIAAGFFITRHDFLHRVQAILSVPRKEFFMKSRSIVTGLSLYVAAMLVLIVVSPSGDAGSQQNTFDKESRKQWGELVMSYEEGKSTNHVTVSGTVVDADGQPVAGATVAPVMTGNGNFSGDTRFTVVTDGDGKFTILLPSNGEFTYNLVAHDGVMPTGWDGWKPFSRRWANGITDPFRKNPGDTMRDVTIRLSAPGTVRGIVHDKDGKPLANHPVRAHAADGKGNANFDPKAYTDAEGRFTIERVRPGTHLIYGTRVRAPEEFAPEGVVKRVEVSAGQTVGNVELLGMDPKELIDAMNKRSSR